MASVLLTKKLCVPNLWNTQFFYSEFKEIKEFSADAKTLPKLLKFFNFVILSKTQFCVRISIIVMPQLGKVLFAKYAFVALTQLTGIYRLFAFVAKFVLAGTVPKGRFHSFEQE